MNKLYELLRQTEGKTADTNSRVLLAAGTVGELVREEVVMRRLRVLHLRFEGLGETVAVPAAAARLIGGGGGD